MYQKHAIVVEQLRKNFLIIQKSDGFINGLSSFIWPRYTEIISVNNISFNVELGSCTAFIGPNGAGKSTVTKILTGILHATSGTVHILGLDPVQDRMQLTKYIGTVFGQKSQLWYHLPPIDTYNLLSRMYELKPALYKERLNFLIKQFDISYLMNSPVRKMSLGERMRCELVGSLLHSPKVLFLDEPTIGLDIIAKQQTRDLLAYLNKEEGVTIFLTSHDVGDIETLTDRTIIINHGSIVFNGSTYQLKQQLITSKIVRLVLQETTDTFSFTQGTLVDRTKHTIKIALDTKVNSVERLLAYAFEHFTILDVTIQDTPLEEIISHIYHQKADQ